MLWEDNLLWLALGRATHCFLVKANTCKREYFTSGKPVVFRTTYRKQFDCGKAFLKPPYKFNHRWVRGSGDDQEEESKQSPTRHEEHWNIKRLQSDLTQITHPNVITETFVPKVKSIQQWKCYCFSDGLIDTSGNLFRSRFCCACTWKMWQIMKTKIKATKLYNCECLINNLC